MVALDGHTRKKLPVLDLQDEELKRVMYKKGEPGASQVPKDGVVAHCYTATNQSKVEPLVSR